MPEVFVDSPQTCSYAFLKIAEVDKDFTASMGMHHNSNILTT